MIYDTKNKMKRQNSGTGKVSPNLLPKLIDRLFGH